MTIKYEITKGKKGSKKNIKIFLRNNSRMSNSLVA